ncbi:Dabb family protein [Streptomyces sp. NPDC058686]|uniref:Dabb family protein n=1 Tax=unclassified Streptomyces TaxID=2593676 RepID=UPI0036589031
MIRHIVLFKFKDGISWDDPRAEEAERVAAKVGDEVPELHEWTAGRNISTRPIAHDFAVIGLLDDEEALERYLVHPFHQEAIRLWREISDWVIADLEEQH